MKRSTLTPERINTSIGEAMALLEAGTLVARELASFFVARHPELVTTPLPPLTLSVTARARALGREGRRCGVTDGDFHRCVLEVGHGEEHQWEP